jgi:hypothetical protein
LQSLVPRHVRSAIQRCSEPRPGSNVSSAFRRRLRSFGQGPAGQSLFPLRQADGSIRKTPQN